MKKYLWMVTITLVMILTGCSKDDAESPAKKDYFPSWNKCEALTLLEEYVDDVTNPKSPNFISVEDRIATFDMDGTLLGELSPSYFEYSLFDYRVLEDPSYKDQAPEDVVEAAKIVRNYICYGTELPDHFDMQHGRAQAKAFAGMTIAEFDAYIKTFAARPANGFTGMTYSQSFYRPMLEVFEYLQENDFTNYVISGSDRFVCRALVGPLGIAPNRVIGMDVKLKSSEQGEEAGVNYNMGQEEYLIRTDELILKAIKNNKVLQISQEIGKVPVLSFGNSSSDCAMHNYCMSNEKYRGEAFMLVADDDARDHADLAEAAKREAKWREAGYHIISMRNDFRTIYGAGVEKVDFYFPSDGE